MANHDADQGTNDGVARDNGVQKPIDAEIIEQDPADGHDGPLGQAPSDVINEPASESTETQTADSAAGSQDTPPPAGAESEPAQNSGMGGMVVGGFLAAALGAGVILALLPEGWRQGDAGLGARLDTLSGQVQDNTSALSGLSLESLVNRVTALESRAPETVDVPGLQAQIDALGDLSAQLAALDARITALEDAPSGLGADAVSAVLAPLNARIESIESGMDASVAAAVQTAMASERAAIDARAETVQEQAETVAQAQARVAAQTALATLLSAAESGEPAPQAVATLSEAADLDPALRPMADGLPTLRSLQGSFPAAARAALAADAPAADSPLGDRLTNSLSSLFGARSLAPREGTSTDAILSRAEAELRAGALRATLAELDALADGPAAALADWRTQAQTRLSALDALETLQTNMTAREE